MLARRIVMLTLLGLCLLAAADYILIYLIGMPYYRNLETRNATETMQRCRDTFDRELEHLTTFCTDWSNWDDTYRFVRDRNAEYIKANLAPTTFNDSNLDLMYIVDTEGKLVWGQAVNPDTHTPMTLEAFPAEGLPSDSPFLPHRTDHLAGLLSTEMYPMLIVSLPIHPTDGLGENAGYFIMGRFLTPTLLGILQRQINVEFHLLREGANSPVLPAELTRDDSLVIPRTKDSIEVYAHYRSLVPDHGYVIRVMLPRQIVIQGFRTILDVWLSMFAVGGVVLVLLLLLLNGIVLRPLTRLKQHIFEVKQKDRLDERLFIDRHDEVGVLAREFDNAIEQLLETRSRLLEASYRSGLAEMAGHLLHDLRNAMTPVSVRITRIRDNLRQVSTEKLEAARQEMEKPGIDPARQRDILHYMKLYHDKIAQLTTEMTEDFTAIMETNRKIEGLLQEHSSLDRTGPVYESVRVSQFVEQLQDRIPDSLRERLEFTVDRPVDQALEIPRIPALEAVVGLLGHLDRAIPKEICIPVHVESNNAFVSFRMTLSEGILDSITFDREKSPDLHRVANTLHALQGGFEQLPGSLAVLIPIRKS